jgi:hypothetical protein
MNKTLLTILAVVVIGAGAYFALNKSSSTDEAQVSSSVTPNASTSSQPSGKKMSFSSFLQNDKGSYKCVVNQDVQGITSTGTVYISNGNVSGKFSTTAQGMNIDTNFVTKDGYSYTWSSLSKTGFKVKVNTEKGEVNPTNGTSGTYSWNAEQIGDYDCQDWNADASVFAVPTSITFTEMNK